MEVACDRAAFGRWNPEVRASGVENNLELLRRRADGNVGEVCGESAGNSENVHLTYTAHSRSC
jgi:hypothetical protein